MLKKLVNSLMTIVTFWQHQLHHSSPSPANTPGDARWRPPRSPGPSCTRLRWHELLVQEAKWEVDEIVDDILSNFLGSASIPKFSKILFENQVWKYGYKNGISKHLHWKEQTIEMLSSCSRIFGKQIQQGSMNQIISAIHGFLWYPGKIGNMLGENIVGFWECVSIVV